MFETNFRLLDQEIYGCFEILLQFRFFRSIICFGFFCFFSILPVFSHYANGTRTKLEELFRSFRSAFFFLRRKTLQISGKLLLCYCTKINVSRYIKSVRILNYSGPYFPAFGLNMERYGVSLLIQSECEKVRTRINPNTDTLRNVYYLILGKQIILIAFDKIMKV